MFAMKLSIITINFNDKVGLERTIKSVSEQTWTDFEFIVVDGGSEDGSIEVIQKFQSAVTSWVSEKDHGIYHAQNKGLGKAIGEYCLFLNSGDYFASPDVLSKVFTLGLNEDIIYGNMMIVRKDGSVYEGKMPDRITFHHMIADTLWHPVSFIRRSLFEKFGIYDESLKMVADYDFFLKTAIVHGVSMKHVNFPIAVFNLDGFSSDPVNRKFQEEERRIVQLRYFSRKTIDTAIQLNRILNSRVYRILHYLKIC